MRVKVRQDLDVWHSFQSLLTLFTGVGSLTDPRAHRHELALQIICLPGATITGGPSILPGL